MLSTTVPSSFVGQLIAHREDGRGLAGRKSGRLYRCNSRTAIHEALKAKGAMSKKQLVAETGICMSIIGRMANAMQRAGEIELVDMVPPKHGGRPFAVFALSADPCQP